MNFRILIALAFVSSSVIAGTCGPNCISCTQSHCITCYNAPFKAQSGPSVCQDTAQPSNNCDLYFNSKKGCLWCKPGYYFNPTSPSDSCTAIPSGQGVENCLNNVSVAGGFGCGVCKGGFPNLTYTKCSPFSTNGPEAHCLWGYKIPGQGKECFRCEEGWVNVSGGCENLGGAGTKWEGCLATNVQK